VTNDLIWLSAAKLSRAYGKRKLSPVEVTKAVIERIGKVGDKLNAFCVIDTDHALKSARAAEKRWKKGKPLSPIDGVPTTIKDIILTRGWPTLRGSKTVDAKQAWDDDAPCVARLREAGSVIIGKTTTPEFGWKGVTDSPLTGITRNPWDTTKTTGGSSGGAAAAVASGMGQLAIGTDGGGSIRIPAGFSGVFGIKPSFGRVPAWPLSPFGSVAHIGPLARRVEDGAMMLDVISRPDARDWTSLPYDPRSFVKGLGMGIKGLRVAYSHDLGYADVDSEVKEIVDAAVLTLEEAGARIDHVAPGFEDPAPIFRTIWWAGVRGFLGGLPKSKRALLDPGLADVLEQSKTIKLEDFLEATAKRGALGIHMCGFMEKYDLLVTPTLPIPAFEAGKLAPKTDEKEKWVNWTPFSFPFNLTQQPAASVPCGFTKAGLPVGLHIVGRMFDDWTVLRAARAYEQTTGWTKKKPKL